MKQLIPLLALAGCASGATSPAAQPAAIAAPVVEDGLPLRALPVQAFPPRGCALYLWTISPGRKLILAARTDTAAVRIALAGGEVDLARQAGSGPVLAGFQQVSRFSDGATTIDWDVRIEQRAEVIDGAVVSEGTVAYTPAAGDAVAVPVTGIVGCRPAAQ